MTGSGTLTLSRAEMLEVVLEINGVLERTRQRSREPHADDEGTEPVERQDWEFMVVLAEAGLGETRPPADGPATP